MAAACAGTERAVLQRWKHRSYEAIPLLLLGRSTDPELTPRKVSQERTSDDDSLAMLWYFHTQLLTGRCGDTWESMLVYRDGLLCRLRFWPVLSFHVVSARELLD